MLPVSGLTSETRAAPPRGAVFYSQRERPTRCGGQTAVSVRFRRCLSLEYVAEPVAKTAPHGGAARDMEDQWLSWVDLFDLSKLERAHHGAPFSQDCQGYLTTRVAIGKAKWPKAPLKTL